MPDPAHAHFKDRYTIERELGRGGMATVYLAEDRKHGRKVAIKVLHPELTASVGARAVPARDRHRRAALPSAHRAAASTPATPAACSTT